MERWRKVWRDGIAPLLRRPELEALASALRDDDPCLRQGVNVMPRAVRALGGTIAPAGACALCYAGWKGLGLGTVGEVEDFFARICHEVDVHVGEIAAVCWFLNWFDDTPREEMRESLLAEARRSLEVLP